MKSPILKALFLALLIGQSVYIFLLHSRNNELKTRLSSTETVNPTPPRSDESYPESLPGQNPASQVTVVRAGQATAPGADSPAALLNNLADRVVDARELTEEELLEVQRQLLIENLSDPRNKENAVRTSFEFQYGGFLDSLDLITEDENALESQIMGILAEQHDLTIQRLRGEITDDDVRNYPLKENIREIFENFLGNDELAQLDEYEDGRLERNRQRTVTMMKNQIEIVSPRLNEKSRELMATTITSELFSLQQTVTQTGDDRTNLFRVAHLNAITKLAENEDIDPDQLELALEYLQSRLEQLPEIQPFL